MGRALIDVPMFRLLIGAAPLLVMKMILFRLLLPLSILVSLSSAGYAQSRAAAQQEAANLAATARAESARGNHQAALSYYVRAISRDPDNGAILMAAGEEALADGDNDAAFGFLGRAVTLDPRDAKARLAYGRALVQAARPKDALTLFGQAVKLGMSEAEVAGDRGLARDLLGDNRKAQRDYRLALGASPGDAKIVQRLGLSLAISGDRMAALELVQPLNRQANPAAVRTLAFIHALTGDVNAARKLARANMAYEQAEAYTPFFARLSLLNPERKALAVFLGQLPQSRIEADGRDVPLRVKMPDGDPVAMRAAAVGDKPPVADGPVESPQPAPQPKPRLAAETALPKTAPKPAARIETPASPCAALSGRRKTVCEADERALARRCADGRKTAECLQYAARENTAVERQQTAGAEAAPISSDKEPVDACAGLSRTKAAQCKADARALERRCGGANPQKTAECNAYAEQRESASAPKKGGKDKPEAKARATSKERYWVQVASGRNKGDLPKEWSRLKAKASSLLARRTPYVADGPGTNRLLIGPFDSLSDARDVVNKLDGAGVSTFPWTSAAGEDVDKLAAK